MKVTVFGASGKVGRLVVQKLLADGHDVTVFVHRLSPFGDNVRVVTGDVHNLDDVKPAIQGSEVVISALGSWGTKAKDIVSAGMSNIIAAMTELGVKRVVSLTGSDALAHGEKPRGLANRLLHRVIQLSTAGKILADGEKHIHLLQDSGLDWSVVRSPVMNNRGDSKNYHLSNTRPRAWATVNRQSVADVMVAIINDPIYSKRAPFIN